MFKNLTFFLFTLLTLNGCVSEKKPVKGQDLAQLALLGEVDERYQSYNVEMVEVTGGRFWAPYGGPEGEVYRYMPPIDLNNAQLRALASHLAPAYMRVSGTWANNTYLLAEGEELSDPPPGYQQILTRPQWQGLVDFAQQVDAEIVTSFAVSDGTRDANGIWQSDQAQRLLTLTRQSGGRIAAAEFFNEPNVTMVGGIPKGYSSEDYTRDFARFYQWAKAEAPDMKILGPGSVGEGALLGPGADQARLFMQQAGMLASEDMLAGNPQTLDAVSYHFYGGVSQRCAGNSSAPVSKLEDALTPAWLNKTLHDYRYYASLRDRFATGKPVWLSETAQAACGGSPWAATFADSFRYLNQLALLAQQGVEVVMHNTLAASDYALIDHDTLTPRPNYWAAVLWRRLMGQQVLASPHSDSADLRLYAHCLAGSEGGVAVLAMNIGDQPQRFTSNRKSIAWILSADKLDADTIKINGSVPALTDDGELTGLEGKDTGYQLTVPSQSIAFLSVENAGHPACQNP